MRLAINKTSIISLILVLIFPLSVFIDLFNGYTQVQLGIFTPIGQIYRIIVMICLLYCIFQKYRNKYFKYLVVLTSYFVIAFPLWIIGAGFENDNGFNLGIEIENCIKTIYFWIIIMFFALYKYDISYCHPLSIINNYGLFIAVAIIFSYITRYGNNSMGEDYGFGTKSYFKAGNDLGITILYSGIISSFDLVKHFTNRNIIKTFIILSSGMLIGSRVAMFGCLFWLLILILYLSFMYNSHKKVYRNRILVFKLLFVPLIICSLVFLVSFIISMLDDFMIAKYSLEGIQNARTGLTDYSIIYINTLDYFKLLFGSGLSCLYFFVGKRFIGDNSYDIVYRAVEADFHELIGGYGIIGFIIIVSPFLYFTLKSMNIQIEKPSFLNFGIVFITLSFLFIAFAGGHCFRNTMAAPIYGFVVSLFYHNRQ